jgi:regulator of protease activity HflC (stomatin/prohibitin superfamily)
MVEGRNIIMANYYGMSNEERIKAQEAERAARLAREQLMKKRIIGGVVAGAVLLGGVTVALKSSETIKPGYVGIVYNLNGGIEKETLGQGLKWFAPWKKVRQYPVSTEQVTMAKSTEEGSDENESFLIPTSDGKTVDVDFDFSYHFNAEELSDTFTTFRGKTHEQIEAEYIKPKMKSYIGEISSQFSVLEIYGEKRGELNAKVLAHVKKKFAEAGIGIDSASFTRIDPDSQTDAAIQKRINAQQALEQEKVEKEKAQIIADKNAIEAQGRANAALIEAQGQAKANKELEQSITPELLKKMEMDARIKHGWVEISGAGVMIQK